MHPIFPHDRRSCSFLQSRTDIVMAVEPFACDGEEKISRLIVRESMEYPCAISSRGNSSVAEINSAIFDSVKLHCLIPTQSLSLPTGRRLALEPRGPQSFSRHFDIVEGKRTFARGLHFLVAFSRQQHNVPGPRLADGQGNRFMAIQLRPCISLRFFADRPARR